MGKLKIVFQHDHPLPVTKYGGIERVIYWHMRELAKLGHEVILIGHSDSKVDQDSIQLIPMSPSDIGDWDHLIPRDSDILHLAYNYTPKISIPTINAIQGNGKIGEIFSENAVFISQSHAHNHGSEVYVYNGLPLEEYPINPRSSLEWKNFLFLGKASWSVKNLKGCIKACKKAHKNLHIAGGRYLWPSCWIHSHGMVGGEHKIQIIQQCDALLFPIRWPEPFGLAIIEAMAMGLPVIGSCYGSLPEIINSEVGIICNNSIELFESVKTKKYDFSPKKVRNYVQNNFSVERNTHEFLKLYHRILAGETLNKQCPTWKLSTPANQLLEF